MSIHNKILDFLEKNRVLTTSELAQHLKVSWNTAEKYLLELALEKKVLRIKKQGVNVWAKKTRKKSISSTNKTNSIILNLTQKQIVITTSELAQHLKVSWNTAEKYLLELALENKIRRIKKVGVNLWTIK